MHHSNRLLRICAIHAEIPNAHVPIDSLQCFDVRQAVGSSDVYRHASIQQWIKCRVSTPLPPVQVGIRSESITDARKTERLAGYLTPDPKRLAAASE
ncbi:hypothetical protein SAMN06265222_103316 [Neorhodopirellula lusitana]|uniref:Uncharacterized protein n=1 Tax=Neorhodopirellula lusitana TaxID=445327 RepID=A0ABY1PWY5_9BACT|nr:hypothetical protein SAMN06265222_103316 [Neorhodopirellula lusitana]